MGGGQVGGGKRWRRRRRGEQVTAAEQRKTKKFVAADEDGVAPPTARKRNGSPEGPNATAAVTLSSVRRGSRTALNARVQDKRSVSVKRRARTRFIVTASDGVRPSVRRRQSGVDFVARASVRFGGAAEVENAHAHARPKITRENGAGVVLSFARPYDIRRPIAAR